MKSPCTALAAIALAFTASQPAAAASDNVAPLLPLSLEELIATPVITASRRQEGREQTPAHIMVITREQMRDRRYKNLADLLEDLPGVDFQRGTRSAQYNNFAFQGHISNNKLLIMLDGVRIDHPAGGKLPIAENFGLYMARQVEVLYGPAAALYGADAAAGVINIITDKRDSPGGKIALGTGSFASHEGNFMVGGKLADRVSLSVGAHQQRSDRADLGSYYASDYPKVNANTFAGATVIPAGQRENYAGGISSNSQFMRLDLADLTISFYRNQFRSLTSTGDPTRYAVYDANNFWDTTLETWSGKYRFDISPSLSGETVVDYSTYEIDPGSRYVNVFTDFQNHGYDYSHARRRGIEQSLNWRVNDRHTVLAGIGYRDYFAIETPDLPQPYNRSASPQGQGMYYPNTNNTLPIVGSEISYYNWSGYLQWQAQWAASFSTMIGLREDWYSTYGSKLNPRVGAVWQALPGNYLKLLYGEAFRTPSAEEMLSAFGSFSGNQSGGLYTGSNFRVQNRQLEPEKTKTLSLTWDWRASRDFNLVTNLYTTRVDDVITTQNEAVSTQYIPGALLSKTTSKQNAGQERYQGIDIIPHWQMHLGGAWMADLWGSYSYIKGVVQDTADGIEWDQTNVATHKLKLGTTFRYKDWLTITPRLQWIGETTTGRKNSLVPGERLKTDAYAVASLHLGMHKLLDERLSFYVDVYNLFDKRYYNAHGSSSTVMLEVPQQPRTLMGTVEYRF